MNISELIESTGQVKGYGARNTFKNKEFGDIYAFNQTIRTKHGS